MADMKLLRPEAGQRVEIPASPDVRIVLDFPAADALLTREGDDLLFGFDGGAAVVVTGFYTAYTKETLPEFEIDGATINGEQFFAALDENLMPAAGPAAAAVPAGGRFNDFGDMGLYDGIDRLGGLDLGFTNAPQIEEDLLGGGNAGGIAGGEYINLTPTVQSHTGLVIEDDQSHSHASGSVLTGSTPGNPEHTVELVSGPNSPYGQFTLNRDGTWTYQLDNTRSDVQALAKDESLSEVYTFTYTDADGDSATGTVTIEINGTNDAPTLTISHPAIDVSEGAAEAATNHQQKVEGTSQGADVDHNAELSFGFAVLDQNGNITLTDEGTPELTYSYSDAYGTLTIDATTGDYSYTLNGDAQEVQSLGKDDKLSHDYTVVVRDEHGAWSEQTVTVNITGANDAPSITYEKIHLKEEGVFGGNADTKTDPDNASNGYIFPEEHRLTASGSLADNVTDTDTNDTHTFSIEFNGAKPGLYTGDKNPVTDDSGKQVTLDVTVQTNETKDGIQTITTNYGTLTLNIATGEYSFVLDGPDANTLNQGEKIDFSFTTVVSDGEATGKHMLGVTIEGTNDKPVLTLNQTTLEVGEHDTASGTVSVTDEDARDTHTFGIYTGMATDDPSTKFDESTTPSTVATYKGQYGTLTIDSATGKYTYTPDHSNSTVAGMLPDDEPLKESFKIVVTDKNGAFDIKDLNVEISGENDKPTMVSEGLHLKDDGVYNGNNATIPDPEQAANGYIYQNEHRIEVSGTLADNVKDVDAGDTHTFAVSLAATTTVNVKNASNANVTENSTPVTTQITVTSNTTEGDTQTIVTNYGTLTLNTATGEYTFALDQEATDWLGQGENFNFMIKATVTDAAGANASANITVKIEGVNDRPVLTLDTEPLGVDEHGTASGTAMVADEDVRDTHTFGIFKESAPDNPKTSQDESVTNTPSTVLQLDGKYGTLVIDQATGKYTYTPNHANSDVAGLSQGDDPLTDSFKIVVKDKNGAFDVKDLNVSITGANDAPEFITGANVLNVVETGVIPGGNVDAPGTLQVEGQIVARDADTADQGEGALVYGLKVSGSDQTTTGENELGHATVTISTTYGTLVIDTVTGTYSYTLSDNAAVNALKPGQTVEDSFTLTVTDGEVSTEQPLKVNVQGTNDRPSIDTVQDLSITEGAENNTFTGQVTASDVEGDTLHFSLVTGKTVEDGVVTQEGDSVQTMAGQLAGKYGYLLIDQATGEYTYHWYADKVQALGDGQAVTEEFVVRATDALGAYSDSTIKVTINGSDNTPTISGGMGGTVHEDGDILQDVSTDYPAITGQVSVSDLDTGDTALGLDSDAPRSYSFGVDEHGNPILSVTGKYGTITIDQATGAYSYTLTANGEETIQGLNQGEHFNGEQAFNVVVSTGQGEHSSTVTGEITIDIVGHNDDPKITHADDLEVNATGELAGTASSTLQADDIDTNDGTDQNPLLFFVGGKDNMIQTIEGTYGALQIAADGTYTYVLNQYSEAFGGIGVGNAEQDVFTVMVSDGHGGYAEQTINVKVNGIESPGGGSGGGSEHTLPQGAESLQTVEDGMAGTHGLISDTGHLTDANGSYVPSDNGAYATFEGGKQTMVGTYGAITINPATGEYTYVLNNNSNTVQELSEGQTKTESFDIYINGVKTEVSIEMTVTGDNDQPTVTSTDSLSLTESLDPDAAVSASGSVRAADVDQDTSLQFFLLDADGNPVASLTTKYGTVTIDQTTGQYTYTLTDASDLANADTVLHDPFTVVVNDQSGTGNATTETTVTVTLKGTNETPVLTLTRLEVTEDGTITASSTANVQDDTTDGFTFAVTDVDGTSLGNGTFQTGTYGTLVLDPTTGVYTYRLDNNHKDVQALGEGDSRTESFHITVTDKHGATHTEEVVVTVKGSNDAPDLFLDARLVATEGSETVVTRQASIVDHDSGDTHTFDLSGTGGTRATVSDDQGQTVQITYTTAYGVFSIDPATGAYSFTLADNDAVKGLAADEIHRDTVTVTVSDGHTTTTRDVSVDIIGTNSAPVVTEATVSEIHEGAESNTIDGSVHVTDVDNNSSLTFALAKGTLSVDHLDGKYGSISLNAETGAYTYTLDATAAQSMAEGAQYPEVFKVWVTDEYGVKVETDITVNVIGDNDAPTLTLKDAKGKELGDDGSIALVEPGDDGDLTYTGSYVGKDVDIDPQTNTMEALTFRITDADGTVINADSPLSNIGTYGTLTLNSNGTYSYHVDDALADSFAQGGQYQDKFWVTVDDGHGGEVTKPLEFTITGVNDDPTLTLKDADGSVLGDAPIALTESDAGDFDSYTGSYIGYDVDIDPQTNKMETLSFRITNANGETLNESDPTTFTGTFGTLKLDDDGTYSYTAKEDAADFQDGQSYTDAFWITVDDGHGGSETKELEFAITGVDNAGSSETPLFSGGDEDVFNANVFSHDSVTDVEVAKFILENS